MASFESQSRARVINMRMTLPTTKKADMAISKYFAKMKSLADEMVFVGKILDDEELVSYILAGLDFDFDGVISAVSARVEPITVSELYGQLLAHEQCWELRQTSDFHSANASSRGGCGGFGHGCGNGRGHGGRSDFDRGNGGHENNFNNSNSHNNL
jgi:ribosomal protein L18E